jgi:hypothetical protein
MEHPKPPDANPNAVPDETPEQLEEELETALRDTFPASDPVGGLANVEIRLPRRKYPNAD